jgi:lipopolysaccharide transport system ATP-binding protein
MKPIIKIENLSKMYRLGTIGTGTISHDLNRWWHRVRGKEDPYLKIGEANVSGNKSDSGYVWALKDINLEVMPGEVLGIIGKNGAGKSTLLKILSRVTGPTTGRISYTGRIGSLLEVGTGFHPELTGRENIFLNGAILGMTKAEISRKLDEIVDFAGVERYIDTPVKRYSSGMRVRLGFAVAAFLEPDILVVDEVLAVGDAEFQKKAIGKMQDVSHQDGRTILFVSHNMASVKNLCNRGILLENGKVKFDNDIDSIIDTYLIAQSDQNNIYHKLLDEQYIIKKGLKITAVRLINAQTKAEISSIMSGMDIVFQMDYEINTSIKAVEIGLIFTTRDENYITSLNNKWSNFKLVPENKMGTVNCSINNFPFMSGLYFIDIIIKSENTVYQKIPKAMSIDVIETDYYNSGIVNANKRQGIFIEQKWEIK